MTQEEIDDALSNPDSFYYVARKKLNYETVKKFKDYRSTDEGSKIRGVYFEEEYKRIYPNEKEEMVHSRRDTWCDRSAVVHRYYSKANCKDLRNKLCKQPLPQNAVGMCGCCVCRCLWRLSDHIQGH